MRMLMHGLVYQHEFSEGAIPRRRRAGMLSVRSGLNLGREYILTEG